MANSNLWLHLSLFIFFTISSFSSNIRSHELPPLPKLQVPLFIFGDSLLDVGNNNYLNTTTNFQANFWPYGETFFKYPTGRWSDGRMIPDFIAQYANLPFLLPFLHPGNKLYINGVNFASGGAGALDETYRGHVIRLKSQLSYFNKVERILSKEHGKKEATVLLSRAVYLISIGSNDYGAFLADSNLSQTHSVKEYVHMVIGNLTTIIKRIHKKGGRKFAVLNVGPLQHAPSMGAAIKSQGIAAQKEKLMQLIKLHNRQLCKTLPNLTGKLKGFVYSHVDFYTLVNEIVENPAKYGFKEVKAACCGSGAFRGLNSCGGKRGIKEYKLCDNPNEYLFFDSGHGTDKAYKIISKQIWSENPYITTPLTLKSLFHML